MYKVLTIAGSDSSGGAGIQADLKTITCHKAYGLSVLTALTAQNTLGVDDIMTINADFLQKQLNAISSDIAIDALKIGMIATAENVKVIADYLNEQSCPVVLDPVMISTSGRHLLSEEAFFAMKKHLLKKVTLITPNVPEAEVLSQCKIETEDDLIQVAKSLSKSYGTSILIKGGHWGKDANDLLYSKGEIHWIKGRRFSNPNTHGTGCTLSTAIACNLAMGYTLLDSVRLAKDYMNGAIQSAFSIGKGRGPLNHMHAL